MLAFRWLLHAKAWPAVADVVWAGSWCVRECTSLWAQQQLKTVKATRFQIRLCTQLDLVSVSVGRNVAQN